MNTSINFDSFSTRPMPENPWTMGPWSEQPLLQETRDTLDWKTGSETFLGYYMLCLMVAFFLYVVYLQFGNLLNPTM